MMQIDLYKQMVTIRTLENQLQALCNAGKAGDLHFNKGQEAIAVGVCAALAPTDYIVTHHRTIAHAIAKGAKLRPLVAEILGKKTGYNGGHAGEMHLSIPSIRHAFSFQLVGTCVPVAVGLAWSLKYFQKTKDVVAVFFGDAASSNGQIHEALNIASIKQVPLLLVCENNHLAGNVKPEHYLPTSTVHERMGAYGIKSCFVEDANEIRHVIGTASEAVEHIRKTGAPFMIEMGTTRLCWHKQGQRDLRSKEVLDELAKLDPIPRLAKYLGIHEDECKTIESDALEAVNEAIAQAESDPLAELS